LFFPGKGVGGGKNVEKKTAKCNQFPFVKKYRSVVRGLNHCEGESGRTIKHLMGQEKGTTQAWGPEGLLRMEEKEKPREIADLRGHYKVVV